MKLPYWDENSNESRHLCCSTDARLAYNFVEGRIELHLSQDEESPRHMNSRLKACMRLAVPWKPYKGQIVARSTTTAGRMRTLSDTGRTSSEIFPSIHYDAWSQLTGCWGPAYSFHQFRCGRVLDFHFLGSSYSVQYSVQLYSLLNSASTKNRPVTDSLAKDCEALTMNLV